MGYMEKHKGGTYLITGAGGFIGSLLVKSLLGSEEYGQGRIRIVGIVRNQNIMYGLFPQKFSSRCVWVEADCRQGKMIIEKMDEPVDYIIHCAAPTASSYMVSHPVETADSIVAGTQNMLELARQFHVKSMVYLSSMEVYGSVLDTGRVRKESELGDVSLEESRSCYPMGKRMAEHYCHIYQQEYGVPVKIARLAQVFGKGIRREDNRVYMQFARSVLEERDIILKTAGESMGNYCASEDAVRAVFTILEKGVDGETYNVANEENTMRIREMAELATGCAEPGKIRVRVEAEDSAKTGYAPDTGLRMSGEKLRGLGWRPEKNLIHMYQDVIEEMRDG